MARLTNHFENDSDTGCYTPIKHHDSTQNETDDENAPPQPPAHIIDPASALRAPSTPVASDPSDAPLASPAAGPAPPPSVASAAAGDDDAFTQIGSPRLSSSRHSAKLSESLSSSSPRWSYENLRNQRWSHNSDVMEKGVHDLKTLGEREGDVGIEGENGPDRSAATKDELNLTVSVNGMIREGERAQANIQDSPEILAASGGATSSKSHPASATTHAASSPKPLIDGPDHNDEFGDNRTSTTEPASLSNGHDDAPPSPLVLPQASLAEKADLNDQEHTIADSDFTMLGVGPAIVESESRQDAATSQTPVTHSSQIISSIIAKSEQDATTTNSSAGFGTHFHSSDATKQEASHNTSTSDATSHTSIPPLDTTDQISATVNGRSGSDNSKIDSAVAADSPARPKVTWDDQAPRTFHSRRVSRDTFTVGQRRPSILLNGAAPSASTSTGTAAPSTNPITNRTNGTTKTKAHSSTSAMGNGNGDHAITAAIPGIPGELVVGSPPTSNAKFFVIMLLSLCGGFVIIRTVRELLGNWGVQGCLMVLGAVLMMRRTV